MKNKFISKKVVLHNRCSEKNQMINKIVIKGSNQYNEMSKL